MTKKIKLESCHPSRTPLKLRRVALSLGVAALFGCLIIHMNVNTPIHFSQSHVYAAVPFPHSSEQSAAAPGELTATIEANSPAQQPVPETKNAVFPWDELISRLAADGFDASKMKTIFSSLNCPPLPEFMTQKALELYGRFGKATLNLPDKQRRQFAPPDYTKIAGGMTLTTGRKVIQSNTKFFESLYKQYGVPAPFVVAVMMVETGLGAELGKQSALLALGSMAATDSLEHVLPFVNGIDKNKNEMQDLIKARSDWAYGELKALIRYAETLGKDAAGIPGSIYGAIGICQFMPSNIFTYGVSTSKTRTVPDVFLFADAASSVARYLSAHGWRKAQTPAAQIRVLLSYNNSAVYASTVYGVASALISPTTHQSAASARSGGNAVKAARENAKMALPSRKGDKDPVKLHSYSDLLK